MSGIVGQNLGRGSGLVKATAVVADSVSGASIVDDAIDSEHYAAGSIDEAHIADNAVTLAKMAGGTDGNIISFDASGDPVAIATGSDGQVLTSTGAGSPPAFEAAAGGGKVLQLVWAAPVTSNQDISSSTFADVTGMTLDITPAATTSKVFVFCHVIAYFQAGPSGISLRIDRDGTVITSQQGAGYGLYDGDETRRAVNSILFYDTPSTSSAVTYKVQANSYQSSDMELHESSDGYMYAIEIGA